MHSRVIDCTVRPKELQRQIDSQNAELARRLNENSTFGKKMAKVQKVNHGLPDVITYNEKGEEVHKKKSTVTKRTNR